MARILHGFSPWMGIVFPSKIKDNRSKGKRACAMEGGLRLVLGSWITPRREMSRFNEFNHERNVEENAFNNTKKEDCEMNMMPMKQ